MNNQTPFKMYCKSFLSIWGADSFDKVPLLRETPSDLTPATRKRTILKERSRERRPAASVNRIDAALVQDICA